VRDYERKLNTGKIGMENITIEKIPIEQKSVLRQLMEFCNYDFSIYDQADVNAYGYFGYERIDHYWTDAGRTPYFIKIDGKYAGFVPCLSKQYG
jgi:hypothetical protein